MTEFFIGTDRVVLPKGLKFTLIDENPLITNTGEYSWDITVSLRNRINAKIFKHIYRINISEIQVSLAAKLIIDNHVRYGKIIILNNSDFEVTFQFISGNAEMNYVAKNEKKIWELDWGQEDSIDYSKASFTINHPGYGEVNMYGTVLGFNKYVCTPVKSGEDVVNNYSLQTAGWERHSLIVGITGKIVMQPYLLYYINKLPELLGYTLKYNVLNSDGRAKNMFVVNMVDSLKYADCLPDMTVTEFIESIENFFNVSFIVNKSDKTISIHNFKSFIDGKRVVTINKADDLYNRDLTEKSKSNRLDFTKISYDINASGYYNYQMLSQQILDKCEVKEFANFNSLFNYFYNNNLEDKYVLYRDLSKMNDYVNIVPDREPVVNVFNEKVDDERTITLVNRFRSYGDVSDRELKLKIVPVQIIYSTVRLNLYDQDLDTHIEIPIQLPLSSNTYTITDDIGLKNTIENGVADIARLNKLEVALFMGKINIVTDYYSEDHYPVILYPFSYCDKYPVYGPLGHYGEPPYQANWHPANYTIFEQWRFADFNPKANYTLSLNGSDGIIADYHQEKVVDTTKPYDFTLPDSRYLTADDIAIINNKRYMPISLEYNVDINGFEKKITGKFYALK